MKNTYEINGDTTVIYHDYKGEQVLSYISTEDLPMVTSIGSWNILQKPDGSRYVQGRLNGRRVLLHRYLLGEPEGQVIDHLDHSGLNNRRRNLQVTNQTGNMRNRSTSRDSKTGHNGITEENGKYRVRIKVGGKLKHLGYRYTLEEAIELRKEGEDKYWV